MSGKNPKRLIESQIRDAVNKAQNDGGDVSEEILKTLARSKVIKYEKDKSVSLLGAAGRVLIVILEDSSFTVRALAVYLGVTEPAIQKSLKILMDAGLIKREKLNNRYIHVPVIEAIVAHPDIAPFFKIKQIDDDHPF